MSNYYAKLKWIPDETMRRRAAERLVKMRDSLAPLRASRRDSSMLLATWNIRDFGAVGKFGSKGRLKESYYYIAEILSCFDLVALQEINENLDDFNEVMDILGYGWDYILTDATAGSGGNGERMAYVYNRDKVTFKRVAGEIVLPKGQLVVPRDVVKPPAELTAADRVEVPEIVADKPNEMEGQQFARTPFLVSFQSGWFRFNLCTVHIYYGEDSGPQLERRIDEIKALVKFFANRQDKENDDIEDARQGTNYILLGDFNVVSPDHETMKALKGNKFKIPEQIDAEHIKDRDHFYDQIAVRVEEPRFKILGGGIVDIYEDVFTVADFDLYKSLLPEVVPEPEPPAGKPNKKEKTPEERYADWKTWQMSDHKPLWVEIQTDFSDDYLTELSKTP